MRRFVVSAFGFAVALFVAASAQQRPNFSGTWVLVSPAQHAGQQETIVHDADTLTLSHPAGHGGHHGIVYRLDGKPSRNVIKSHGEDIVSTATASWNGAQLVVQETTRYPDGRVFDRTMTFELDAEGQLVRNLGEKPAGSDAMPNVRAVYKKKS